jgi:hypothetical protein
VVRHTSRRAQDPIKLISSKVLRQSCEMKRKEKLQGGIRTGSLILTFFRENKRLWKMARAGLPESARAERGQRTVWERARL